MTPQALLLAILADNYRTEPDKLAAASGILFALVNAGFGLGVGLSGLLPPSLRSQYTTSAFISLLGTAVGIFTVRESLPIDLRVPFKLKSFNPFAFTRLLSAGQRRRLALSRLLLGSRPLWLLDEPTVALDAQSVEVLGEVVAEHRAAGGMVLAATHVEMPFGAAEILELSGFRASEPVIETCTPS